MESGPPPRSAPAADTAPDVGDTHDGKWEQLLHRLESGDCAPFLGAGACAGILPLASELADSWATRYGYPLPDRADLHQVMQFVTVAVPRYSDPSDLKRDFLREHFGAAALPAAGTPTPIHTTLASFPLLSQYVTTNYDDLMMLALRQCGRHPVVGISPWQSVTRVRQTSVSPWYFDPAVETWRDRSAIGAGWRPGPERPLVFHLHGHHSEPGSLILTEDDYVEYLVKIATERQPGKGTSVLPPYLYEALAEKPLLFIGYSLQDWTFRVLFRALLRNTPKGQRRKHVSVQLPPPKRSLRPDPADTGPTAADNQESGGPADDTVDVSAQAYLTEYFRDQDITVFWESASAFAAKLQAVRDRYRQGGP